jgi:hypothetical protein
VSLKGKAGQEKNWTHFLLEKKKCLRTKMFVGQDTQSEMSLGTLILEGQVTEEIAWWDEHC